MRPNRAKPKTLTETQETIRASLRNQPDTKCPESGAAPSTPEFHSPDHGTHNAIPGHQACGDNCQSAQSPLDTGMSPSNISRPDPTHGKTAHTSGETKNRNVPNGIPSQTNNAQHPSKYSREFTAPDIWAAPPPAPQHVDPYLRHAAHAPTTIRPKHVL